MQITDEAHVSRGDAARVLLESSTYQCVRDELTAEYTQAILDSDFKDAEVREEMFRIIRAFQLLQAVLVARVELGRVAALILENPATDNNEEEYA